MFWIEWSVCWTGLSVCCIECSVCLIMWSVLRIEWSVCWIDSLVIVAWVCSSAILSVALRKMLHIGY